MNWYIELVTAHPILTAMLQLAVLGTLGDAVSHWIVKRKIFSPYDFKTLILKIIEWSILAVMIKYAFIGFQGFADSLINQSYLPQLSGIGRSFTVSALMNLQFGPLLVIIHRLMDNLIAGKQNWKNLDKGFYSLLWFWIPAHTITFILPKEFQIGLAAVWSLALGIILGFYNRKAST
jgi:hypothetical protein